MGVVIGVVLFIVAFPLLGWNEGRAIHRTKTLEAGGSAVISVPADPVAAANEGQLVHVTGRTAAEGAVTDPVFGLTEHVIKLRRDVEMYQWTEEKKSETQKKLGGGEETVTTYSYTKTWSSTEIDSADFQKPDGHRNPDSMPIESETFAAEPVTVGAFTLTESLVGMIDDYRALPITKDTKVEASDDLPAPATVYDRGFYIGADPKTPAIGDLRVHFQVVEPGDVSIVAGQIGDTFEPYVVKDLGDIELLQTGTHSAKSMFATAQQANVFLTWALRIAGFFIMYIGLALIFQPISVLADIIPFFGNIAEAGTGLLAFLIALPLTLLTIAIAWVAFRPLIGIPLLIAAIASIVFAIRTLRKKKAPKAVAVAA